MSDEQNNKPQAKLSHSRLTAKLLLGVVGMFAFGFALVPLYDVFCEITGLNGKTGGQYSYEASQVEVDESRLVTIQFRAMNNAGMSWQAVPSVSPFRAADYLRKTECFCFNQQTLAAGQDIDMPLLFFIDQDIPEDVTKLTLSYTLFDVTASYQQSAGR